MKKSSLNLQEATDLIQQAKTSEVQLQITQSELLAAQKKKQRLNSEIEAETKRLLVKRQAQLDLLEKEAADRLETLKKGAVELEDKVIQTNNDLVYVENTITERAISVDKLNTQQDWLVERVSTLEKSLEAQDELISVGKIELSTLEESVADLTKQKDELNNDIEHFSQKKSDLEQDIMTYQKDYEATKARNDKELETYSQKLIVVKQQILSVSKEQDMVRGELAARQLAQDRRDENLKIRERKVEMNEQRIQNNANLLDL